MKINEKHIQKGFEMKDSMIESAISLFSKKSYDGTSIKDITDSVGSPKSLFYHYFSSKEELLQTIIQQYELRVTKNEKDAILENSTEDSFGDIISRIFLKIHEEPDILRLMVLEALKNDQIFHAFLEKIDVLGADFNSIIPDEVQNNVEEEELLVFRFYFRFIPIILFSLTEQIVSRHYGCSPETFKQQFMKLLKYNPYLSKLERRSENEDSSY